MTETELFDKIEDYLKGRLSAEAQQAFEADLVADPKLAETVALHRDMMEATVPADVIDLRRLMEGVYLAEITRQEKKSSGGWSFTLGGMTRLAAAASVLLVIAAGVWWAQRAPQDQPIATTPTENGDTSIQIVQVPVKPDTQQVSPSKGNDNRGPAPLDYAALVRELYDQSPYSPGVLMSEGGDEAGSPLEKATVAYGKNQLSEVLYLLAPLPEEGRTEALKLRAHAGFRLKQYDQAAADFEVLTKSMAYRSNAEWYLLLCHAARLPKSKVAFDAAMATVLIPGHPFEKQAVVLKNKLSKK